MNNVPQELIEEARKRGIVPGARIIDTWGLECEVPPTDFWEIGERKIGGIPRISVESKGKYFCIHSCANETSTWATVITPAEPEGLKEGDACECGPAMRAAIIELAKELGIPSGGLNPEHRDLCGIRYEGGNIHTKYNGYLKARRMHSPEAFISRMRITAKQPKPIKIDGHEVKHEAGHIKVGCQTIPNATVRAIAEKLID